MVIKASTICTLAEPGNLVKNDTVSSISINDFVCKQQLQSFVGKQRADSHVNIAQKHAL